MAHIIAIANQKGGVGKTAAMNLEAYLADANTAYISEHRKSILLPCTWRNENIALSHNIEKNELGLPAG